MESELLECPWQPPRVSSHIGNGCVEESRLKRSWLTFLLGGLCLRFPSVLALNSQPCRSPSLLNIHALTYCARFHSSGHRGRPLPSSPGAAQWFANTASQMPSSSFMLDSIVRAVRSRAAQIPRWLTRVLMGTAAPDPSSQNDPWAVWVEDVGLGELTRLPPISELLFIFLIEYKKAEWHNTNLLTYITEPHAT